MQISLDYYRILGIPIQAESNLIEQAYQDRILQLPHKGYSDYAITSRNNLLNQAYGVLINDQSRLDYESSFFSSSIKTETEEVIEDLSPLEETSDLEYLDDNEVVQNTIINIEIEPNLFIGALIILLDLGEYELILTLTEPYLKDKSNLNDLMEKEEELTLISQDLVLTVVLAYLELARERWQEQEYESASDALIQSYNLLFEEDLFPSLRKEIKQDLGKLQPYQILELVTRENSHVSVRQKAVTLLKNMFNARGGIESQKIDESGLDIDGFLRFIQQIRVYLTAEEQQLLFEEEAQRPSPAAGYLAAYAGIARGFTQRRPEFIIRAKNSLISLTIHQDVYLEQSICALLLGQTAEAEFSLSQSREKKVIGYIQEMSQGSPDLLPGLCVYTEKWLQTEVFPQFKNLSGENPSLQEYFADDKVQSYLETITKPLSSVSQEDELLSSPELELPYHKAIESHQSYSFSQFNALKDQTDYEDQVFNDISAQTSNLVLEQETEIIEEENEKMSLFVEEEENEDLIGFDDFMSTNMEVPQNSSDNSSPVVITKNPSSKVKTNSEDKSLLIILSILGLSFLIFIGFIGSRLLSKEQGNRLEISISEPVIELLPDDQETVNDSLMSTLDKTMALEIINQWLNAKGEATGPNYNINELNKILKEPQLSFWIRVSRDLRNKNAYKRYEHKVIIQSAQINPQDLTQGIIIAKITEKSQYYRNGELIPSLSYQDNLLVTYELVKEGDQWFIKNGTSKVIN
ncbi:MAG: DUF4101 domain-containing protein [Cyanobacteria bacterium]|nr:DUF4101 domain-containing protein [Cyanobacteria bacterium CG_2015-16_32_12]NCO76744.1 DUF4101 domain-containing protein [Cyanobacteria bacterium CG_2015-22_32_23]NCQ04390.1 DUF4101 domain-containing protein [Cyanobacteria bacterium CG_2015-09_32_10]NCQ43002.1 DUF4101 domain-containing protein [Cyanobacteria bacterium CG_2015-04_32_10]